MRVLLQDLIYQMSVFQLLHGIITDDIILPHLSALLEISKTPWCEENTSYRILLQLMLMLMMSKQESIQLTFTFSIFKVFIHAHLCASKCTTVLDDESVARLLKTCASIHLKINVTSVFNDDTSSVF